MGILALQKLVVQRNKCQQQRPRQQMRKTMISNMAQKDHILLEWIDSDVNKYTNRAKEIEHNELIKVHPRGGFMKWYNYRTFFYCSTVFFNRIWLFNACIWKKHIFNAKFTFWEKGPDLSMQSTRFKSTPPHPTTFFQLRTYCIYIILHHITIRRYIQYKYWKKLFSKIIKETIPHINCNNIRLHCSTTEPSTSPKIQVI